MSPGAVAWALAGALFVMGLAGLALRRQLLAMLLGLELMTNAVNVAIAYEARVRADAAGLAAVFLLLAVAACEAVVGLSLIIALSRDFSAADTAEIRDLRG